jgi:hypothetical protein
LTNAASEYIRTRDQASVRNPRVPLNVYSRERRSDGPLFEICLTRRPWSFRLGSEMSSAINANSNELVYLKTAHCSFPWTPSTLIMFVDYRCSLRFLWNWKVSYGVRRAGKCCHVGLSVANGTPLYVHCFGYPLASSLLPTSS